MQASPSPRIVLVRHGETAWSKSGQHTGRTDIALTADGRQHAVALGQFLQARYASPGQVWTSPLARAQETCRLAGYGATARVDPDLPEWDYGIYEGRTTLEIRQLQPEWSVWKSEITGGEALEQVAARTLAVIERATQAPGDVILFAHGHVLRILAATWMGLPPLAGRYLALDTASVSVLGYERQTRVIRQWNLTPAAGPA